MLPKSVLLALAALAVSTEVLAAHVSECNDPSHLIGSENLEQLPQQVAIGEPEVDSRAETRTRRQWPFGGQASVNPFVFGPVPTQINENQLPDAVVPDANLADIQAGPPPTTTDEPKKTAGGDIPVTFVDGSKSNVADKLPYIWYETGGKPVTTSDSLCQCPGGYLKGKCYKYLGQAFNATKDGDTLQIAGEITVQHPIGFKTKTLTIEGADCGGKATLIADMDVPAGAILMPASKEHKITLKNIKFTRAPKSGYAAALHMYNHKGSISLTVKNCDFVNLKTKFQGGSALYLATSKNTDIDGACTFENNIVDTRGDPKHDDDWVWGGGGAVYINNVWEGSIVTLDGTYKENKHYFQHGLGGAACVEYIEGTLDIVGTFLDNTASDGGAVHVGEIADQGIVVSTGTFKRNKAIEYGLGCRGGAIRPWFVRGTLLLGGTFEENTSDGRGGVFATNRLYKKGKVTIRGTYINNKAAGNGGIYSITNEATGVTTLAAGTTFQGNTAKAKKSSLLSINPGQFYFSESQWTGEAVSYQAAPDTTVKGTNENERRRRRSIYGLDMKEEEMAA